MGLEERAEKMRQKADASRARSVELREQAKADAQERREAGREAKGARTSKATAFAELAAQNKAARQHDAKFEGLKVRGDTLWKGLKQWPVAECEAIVDQGVAIAPRLTASRVALTGPFALLLKKDRSKVYLAVTVPGDGILIEVKGKHEGEARQFATKLNLAAELHRTSAVPLEDAAPAAPAPSIPAGWYPNGNVQQYWDGDAWTDQTAPLPPS